MTRQLVMYSRTTGCPFVTIAKRVLEEHKVPYHEVYIDQDEAALERVLAWTGFRSVPTLVVADAESLSPYTDFDPLPEGESPRGIDRGPIITEPNMFQLKEWLIKHQLIVGETR